MRAIRTLRRALLSRCTLLKPLWAIRLLEEKAVTGASDWSWSDEADACDVHRSLSGDISVALLAVGTSERSCEGRPFALDPWLATG